MEKCLFLSDLIRKGVAVVCRAPEEVVELSEMAELLFPGYGKYIAIYANSFNHPDCKGEIAIRLEKYHNVPLDYGWDFPSYYKKQKMKLVYLSELRCDLGEINVDTCSVCDLLFGG